MSPFIHKPASKVTTIPRTNVRDRIGQLSDADLIRLDRALIVFLGIAD